MDIYIKPAKKASLAERSAIYIRDFCEVIAPQDVAENVKNMKLLDIYSTGKKSYLISVTDIIKTIQQTYPDFTVSNVGEIDTLIDYSAVKSKDNRFFKWLKIAFVTMVLVAGSATAIMSFHSDADIPKIFQNYYKIFYGKENDKPLIIDIPYSVGLAVGILVFFNHFMGKKFTDDPTPIEVEMSLYEKDITNTKIDLLDTQKLRRKEGKDNGNL